MTLKVSLKTVILQLVSVSPITRKLGMKQLDQMFLKISPEFYKKVSYGLFYYFWSADGFD